MSQAGPLGLIVNPMSGRDVRRLVGRAQSETPDGKRNQLQRAIVGAAAAGVDRVLATRDLFRITERAMEYLDVGVSCDFVEMGKLETKPSDTRRAALAMQEAGCTAVIVLGGDGTNRIVTQAWPDAVLMPLSTGTNNVFPWNVEPTLAGAAAGLVASGRLPLDACARRAKLVHAETADGERHLGVIDAVRVVDDHPGSLMPFEASKIRDLLLARAEPGSVGMSPIGGLLEPCGIDDDFAVAVRCVSHEEGGQRLLVPISPGLFRTAHVADVRRVALGERVAIEGPGLIEFDGDREIQLAAGEQVQCWVERDGPWVIDPHRALREAAARRLYVDRPAWRDGKDDATGFDCC